MRLQAELVSLFLTRLPDLRLHFCEVVGKHRSEPLAVLLLLLWMARRSLQHPGTASRGRSQLVIFTALALSADLYFAPAVANIAAWLHLSDDVAGATLLALGNGAPDFFTDVAAITAGSHVDMPLALGEGVGAGLYVTCFCLAVSVLYAPPGGVPVPPGAFARDALFYLLGLAVITGVALDGAVTAGESAVFVLLYAAYVLTVLFGGRLLPALAAPATAHAPPAPRKSGAELEMVVAAFEREGEHVQRRAVHNGAERMAAVTEPAEPAVDEAEGPPSPVGYGAQLRAWLVTHSGVQSEEGWRWALPVTAPVRLALALTMPSPQAGSTVSPVHIALAVFFAPLFLLAVGGVPVLSMGWVPVATLLLLRVGLVAAALHVLPPRGLPGASSRLVNGLAFLVSIAWMDICASEVVAVFQALGRILGLPEALLGGTIMCWAASMGDLVGLIAVVKRGMPNAAITSAFAGPIFQLLCGLGASLLIETAGRGVVVPIVLDDALKLMFAFALAVMAYFLVAVPFLHRHVLSRRFAWALAAAYIVFVIAYSATDLEE